MKMMNQLAAGVAVAVLAFAGSASAAVHVLNYVSSGGTPMTGHFVITTLDTLNAASGYDITGISGDIDGDMITSLTLNPNQPFTATSADGLFNYDDVWFSGMPHLSNGGVLGTLMSGLEFNFFSDNADTYELYLADGRTYTANSIGTAFGAVPEPATWALMIAGFGLAGMSLRRRQLITA